VRTGARKQIVRVTGKCIAMRDKSWRTAPLLRLAALWVMVIVAPARANDSAADLAAGGLVMVKNDAITIQREDLHISPQVVRVRYEMRNNRADAVTLRVAFPMPEIPVEGILTHRLLPHESRPNPMRFQVRANGDWVTPEVEVRAVLPDGQDIASELRKLGGWSLLVFPRMMTAEDGPPEQGASHDVGPTIIARLKQLNAVETVRDAYFPRWKTWVTFHWQQRFVPGVTVIEHQYDPVMGFFPIWPKDDRWHGGLEGPPDQLAKTYCIGGDDDTALRAASDRTGNVYARTLSYILTTGANWAGPIENFNLVIDAAAVPGQRETIRYVLGCAEFPLVRRGPLRLEGSARNYVPKSELRLLLIREPRG